MTGIVLSIVALVFAVAALVYSVKVALVYHRFNEQIKSWSESLDDQMEKSIYFASRRLLESLDASITEKNKTDNDDEDKLLEA